MRGRAIAGIRNDASHQRRRARDDAPYLRAVIFLILPLLAFGSLLFYRSSPPDPVWEQKRLSLWLDDLATGSSKEVREPAAEALQNMGPASFPFLVELFRKRDTAFRRLLIRLNQRQQLVHFPVQPVGPGRIRALLAFEALGSEARPVLPQLERLLAGHQEPQFVADAMAAIGPESVRPILEAVPKVARDKRCMLLRSAMKWPSQKGLIKPALQRSLQSSDLSERQCAAELLAQIEPKAQ